MSTTTTSNTANASQVIYNANNGYSNRGFCGRNGWYNNGTTFRTFMKRFFPKVLPADFPDKASFGSVELKNWVEKSNFRNWRAIPRIVQSFSAYPLDNNNRFNNDVQGVIARLLDIILFETNAPASSGTLNGILAFNANGKDSDGQEFFNVSLQPGNGVFYVQPYIRSVGGNADEKIIFRVTNLAKMNPNTPFYTIDFEFPTSLFDANPIPSTNRYRVRVNQPQEIPTFLNEIDNEKSISEADRRNIYRGVMTQFLLPVALNGTQSMGQLEQDYSMIIGNYANATILGDNDSTGYRIDFFNGNQSIANVDGQTPTYRCKPIKQLSQPDRFVFEVEVENVYFDKDMGRWRTGSSASNNNVPLLYMVTDSMTFELAGTIDYPLLRVVDRQIALRVRSSDPNLVYPFYVTEPARYLLASRNIAWVSSRGLNENLTMSNLSLLSGNPSPFVQALLVAYAQGIATKGLPTTGFGMTPDPINGTEQGPNYPFTYTSQFFTTAQNKNVNRTMYNSSLSDIFKFFGTRLRPTFKATCTPSAINLQDMGTNIKVPVAAVNNGMPSVDTFPNTLNISVRPAPVPTNPTTYTLVGLTGNTGGDAMSSQTASFAGSANSYNNPGSIYVPGTNRLAAKTVSSSTSNNRATTTPVSNPRMTPSQSSMYGSANVNRAAAGVLINRISGHH